MTPALELVFDLDGTLVDSVGDLATAASELVTRLGGRPLSADEVGMMVGEGAGVLVARALAAAGLNPETPGALAQFLEIYDQHLLDSTRAYPGMVEALQLASRRARLTVLTNKPQAASERLLDALGLAGYFALVIGGDGPLGRKPDPAGLRALTAGSRPVMLIGDSPIDHQTAANAGAAFGWARYGFGARKFAAPPDTPYVLDDASGLLPVLDRFEALMRGA